MRKMPSLFVRDWEGNRSLVTRNISPGCEWVVDGSKAVIATKKWDGTAVLIDAYGYWKRYDAKHGKPAPYGFKPAQLEPDPVTGHWPGWLKVTLEKPEDKWFIDALTVQDIMLDEVSGLYEHGTYELCGPKIGGNPEGFDQHTLVKHGVVLENVTDFSYDGIKKYLEHEDTEGIVFYSLPSLMGTSYDVPMCKIKKSDFGLPRKPE